MSNIIKDEILIKEQTRAIDELQEKVRLLQFDVSKNLENIRILKDKLERKKQTIIKVRDELEIMAKENNYKNINFVLSVLKGANYEE